MRPRVLVAGSGKMGRDIGLHLVGRGFPVTWLTREAGRLEEIEAWVSRKMRGVAREDPEIAGRCAVGLAEATIPDDARFLVETVEEDLEAKRDVVTELARRLPADALILSNSSSLLPGDIHPRCVGLHFFHPVGVTETAEAVFPPGTDADLGDRVRALARDLGLTLVEQDLRSAFVANRILVPLQSECMMDLRAGCPARQVDEASANVLVGIGQPSLMDAVGLDVILPAVRSYVSRMPGSVASHHAPLVDSLDLLVRSGKRGRKNRDGLCTGEALPWAPREGFDAERLRSKYLHVFINSCSAARDLGLVTAGDLDLVLESVYGAETTVDACIADEGREALAASLAMLYEETERPWFRIESREPFI